MSFGQAVVNVDGFLRRLFRFGEKFGWHITGKRKRAICVRKSDVGQGVVRVNLNRLLEI